MKRGQTWIFDYIAGFLMFIFLLFLSLNLLQSVDAKSNYETVNREVDRVSNALLSPGFPSDWNATFVTVPGLTVDERIDIEKLKDLDSLSYDRTKALFQVTGEYWFYFVNSSGVIPVFGQCIRGYSLPHDFCDVPNIETFVAKYSDVAWSERIVVLNSQIVSLVVVVWR